MAGSASPKEKILAVCELAKVFKRADMAQDDNLGFIDKTTQKPVTESRQPLPTAELMRRIQAGQRANRPLEEQLEEKLARCHRGRDPLRLRRGISMGGEG